MKQIKLNLIKKNRVYFKCLNEKGFEVKLKIDNSSENLELGEHDLLVDDISIRSKYGVDIIYSLNQKIDTKEFVNFQHKYNKKLIEECRNLGGKWDESTKVWSFPKVVEDKIEDLDYKYNCDFVDIELEVLQDTYGYKDSLDFLGYPLIKASGRDSGAKVCDNVSMIQGKIFSAGSVKNWSSEAAKGTKFRFSISKNLLNSVEYDKNLWEVKIL